MKITVGGRKYIDGASFLVPPSEEAWLEFDAEGWAIKLNVLFRETEGDDKQLQMELQDKGDYATLVLSNWTSQLPLASLPYILGETNGKKIEMFVGGYAVGDAKRIELAFYWEKENG